jgi:glutamate synthase (NADPH/NADH) small chain
VGVDITGQELRSRYDAVVLAVGATQWRDIAVPGRDLRGIYQAMEYLPWGNKQGLGELESEPPINAAGKHVVILGGGDTGADCLGTAIRQGAASVTQLEIMPRPTDERPASQPWPTYPMIYRVSSAHEEAGERLYAVSTEEFLGDEKGNLKALKLVETQFIDGKFEKVAGSEREIPADLVFLAMGFTGPEKSELVAQLEVELDARGNIKRDEHFASSEEGVFVCGDAGRGQSLIVWAIAEGRSAAAAVDEYLLGETGLPSPIEPTSRSLTV